MRLTWRNALIAAVFVFGLAGCEALVSQDKGVYSGTPDQELSPEKVEELRQRGLYQRG